MATSFLRFCRAGNVDGMAFAVGVFVVECAVGEGRIYTGEGQGKRLLVAWAVGFWGSSPGSFPLPSSPNKGRISYFFSPWPIYHT